MRKASVFLILLLSAVAAPAQGVPAGFDISNYGVRLEPDKRVMLVLATLEMAQSLDPRDNGARIVTTPLSEKGTVYRQQLLVENADLPEDLRKKISIFVTGYKKRHPGLSDTELVTPFVSMAYALQPAPDLSDPRITSDLPGELLDVLDFAPLVREFYRRSSISGRLDEYVKQYKADAETRLRPTSREMVSDLLNYLHTRPRLVFTERVKTSIKRPGTEKAVERADVVEHERHFNIVPERLIAKGTIQFVNVRDDYYVVVPTETDLTTSEARRAFLRFVIDPLVIENAKNVDSMREWGKQAVANVSKTSGASPDVFLAVSRSLVAAIDVRQQQYAAERLATNQARQRIALMKTDAEKKAVAAELERYKQSIADEAALDLYDDYSHGAVFAYYFADELRGMEDSQFDIATSLKEMLLSFDGTKERDRVASTEAARNRAVAARLARKNNTGTEVSVAANPVTTRLLEIQKTIDAKDYDRASADLRSLVTQYPSEPRIHYIIGRVAGLSAVETNDATAQRAKLQEAQEAYSNVLRTANASTDPALLSLTYVALGRIYEFGDEKDYAIKLYDKAIALGEVPAGGYKEAWTAKQRLIKP